MTDLLETRVANAIRSIPDYPKPGVDFKDISPILADVALVRDMVEAFAEAGRETGVNMVCGIESRGFYFGTLIAQALGVPFMPIRKRGRMPGSSAEFYSYDLEYGSATIEMSTADLPEHSKVMLHDDLLATGSTAAAAAKLIRDAGSEIVMFAFIGHLEYLEGDEKLLSYSHNIFTLAQV